MDTPPQKTVCRVAALLVTFTVVSTHAQTLEPEIFAPSTISAGNVYRGSFTPDGQGFYFFKKVTEGAEDYRIFHSRIEEGHWTQPKQVNLGGDFSDLYPALSPDGQRMVFSSYRPAPGDTSAHPSAYLWYAERTSTGWGEPVFMDQPSTFGHYHSQLIFDAKGALSFARQTWNYRQKTQWTTRWDGQRFQVADTLVVWQYWRNRLPEGFYLYEATPGYDGTYALLVVGEVNQQTGWPGPADLWVASKSSEGWGEAYPLGDEINTPGVENFAFFSPDGQMLYFVRAFNEIFSVPMAAVLGAAERSSPQ